MWLACKDSDVLRVSGWRSLRRLYFVSELHILAAKTLAGLVHVPKQDIFLDP